MKSINRDEYPRAIILSYKAQCVLINLIESLGIEIIFSSFSGADKRISDHPDLQIHPLKDGEFVASKDTYEYYKSKLKKYDVKILEGDLPVGDKYPQDCRYNIFSIHNRFVCKKDAIDIRLRELLESEGYEMIDQKQGYAKCMSICFDDFVITCDMSIHRALTKNNIENYYISPEGIDLDGFEGGFLGGSCGIIKSRKILFTGDIYQLKDVDRLTKILNDKDIEWIYPDSKLIDIGSIIPVY